MRTPVTVNSRRFDGTISRSWQCDLLLADSTELLLKGTFDRDIHHPELGLIRQGTISHEYFWLDRWYSIFIFLEPEGTLRNYYCNVNLPPTFNGSELDYVDLDLDVVVWPDRSTVILDRDEFEANAIRFGYPADLMLEANAAVEEILRLADQRLLPSPHHKKKFYP